MVLALFVTDPDANTEDEAGPSDIQDEEEEVELELGTRQLRQVT